MVTLSGSLFASRAFPTLLCKAMSSSVSTIISSNFSSNSFFRNWMSLSRLSEEQNENSLPLLDPHYRPYVLNTSVSFPYSYLVAYCHHFACIYIVFQFLRLSSSTLLGKALSGSADPQYSLDWVHHAAEDCDLGRTSFSTAGQSLVLVQTGREDIKNEKDIYFLLVKITHGVHMTTTTKCYWTSTNPLPNRNMIKEPFFFQQVQAS